MQRTFLVLIFCGVTAASTAHAQSPIPDEDQHRQLSSKAAAQLTRCLNLGVNGCLRACREGEAGACNQLGVLYDEGRFVREDDIAAAHLYERACEGGDMRGCYNFGYMLSHGSGVERDNTRALKFYQRACAGGEGDGCDPPRGKPRGSLIRPCP